MLGLSCPYLPKIEAAASLNGQVLVLEEYIQGDSLAYLLEGGPLPPEHARRIALQVCQALEVLHGLGIVHRDIKPENILLRGNEAVLIDFDASRIHKSEGLSDTRIMGTTGYAAPEQYGFSQTDARADIYSVGILLNEMLTGKHPSTCLAVGPLQPLIEKCIEVNVNKRYPTVAEVIAALDIEPISARKRWHWLWAIPAAALLFAGLFLLRPSAEPVPMAGNSSGEPSTPSPIPEELLQDVSVEAWTGSAEPSYMIFEYDLDGDGKTEPYYFFVGSDFGESHGLQLTITDSRSLIPDITSELSVAPAVAKHTETGLQYAYEFSELLKSPSVTLYCSQQWGTDEPEVMAVSPLDGLWPGATLIQFDPEDTGIWVYEATAELNGETLVARGVSTIFADTDDDT